MNKAYNLCVIGSGPAGIITVLEYMEKNPHKTVLLVEFGFPKQAEKNTLDESIEIRNPINHYNPYHCTNKGLGGTTLTWGGRCVMYDKIDFLKRPSVNGSCTWDLEFFNQIEPYFPKAAKYLECGDPVFDLKKVHNFMDTCIAENFKEGMVSDSIIERWSMPTRFGKRYGKRLKELSNLKILMGHEARDFGETDEQGVVGLLYLKNVRDHKVTEIHAENFVIASGAQESTRILLRNKHIFGRLKRTPPALGKFYQGHLSGKICSVIFDGDPKKTDFGFMRNLDGTYIRRRFQFKTEYLQENDLLNTAFWLDNPLYFDPEHKSGAMSFMYLAMRIPFLEKKLAPPAIAQSMTKGKTVAVGKHIWNLVKDFPGSFITPATIFFKRYLKQRKLPGIFLFNRKNKYALHFHAEQLPIAENRMELGPDGETLIIHYQLTDKDVDSVVKLHKALDKHLRENKCGRLEYWYEEGKRAETIKQNSKDGVHQIGTTRIANSSEDGVVDRDLKVFGTQNIYVCSSSVFPTSGQANPTFFLGACAARLANHL